MAPSLRSSLTFLLLFAFALASPVVAAERSSQCTVTVLTKMKSGNQKKRIFHTQAASLGECAEDARLHNENYFPPKISAVNVEYDFGGAGAVALPEAR